jgi:predicted metal-dependent HD superfamily phosphohydrolase
VNAHSEPQRHYHTLSHIEAMYGQYYAVRDLVPEFNVINSHLVMVLAIAFHDIVYEPKSKTN